MSSFPCITSMSCSLPFLTLSLSWVFLLLVPFCFSCSFVLLWSHSLLLMAALEHHCGHVDFVSSLLGTGSASCTGVWVLLEGACACSFCLQWLCSSIWLLFPDPHNVLIFLPTLYMCPSALQQPSNHCTAVFYFSDANLCLKVYSQCFVLL